ncbi:transferase 2, rSAM/selenodomain-associated [Desulfocicer vacuolatum DSM 3385]|uniref:Transferase 2, rSAM/selenodomain-associated n=1 Tax=Desulfocicer vacuolatum DSM 3385 TaxID=1121400 RepID=A0A1W2B835_9BACT|nr:TIGR04283 family arsenosugar biosynthesis glycosyltransferase [Desulfocicer vacuolatum]SMC68538.1 transferase 2, rSAM/selenodomain-associated [Desulfocicer vacuolatum DSM 3385]
MFISVIIPVLHETKINCFLSDLLEKKGKENLEIIVVDGDPTGSTLNLISDKRVIKLTSPKGRAIQQNKGAEKAVGDILLFLHADTLLPHGFVQLIGQAVFSGNSGGAFDLCIDSSHPFLKFVSRVASIRSRVTRIPYGDQAIFINRDLFLQINGFPEIPLMEDIALMRKVKKTRVGFKILPVKVVTSARKWIKDGMIYTGLRNPILAMFYYLGVSPRTLVKFYY